MKQYIILAAAACAVGVLILLIRAPGAAKKALAGAAGGLAAFGAVNLTGMLTGVSLAANLWTIGVSLVLGIPGVVGMMFLKLIMGF